MSEYIIENITEAEEKLLDEHPEIEWYPDDILLSRDIVVHKRSDAEKILQIIGRRNKRK